jgi:hypothetical protein
VNGQDGRDLDPAPGAVSRHEGCLPIIGMNQVRCPILVQTACGELGCGRGKAGEAHVVVRPVAPRRIAIGIAGTIIELRAQQHVDRQAIPGRCQSELAGRHLCHASALSNYLNMCELFDDIAITRQQDPNVAPEPKCPGKGCRNRGKAADADEVVHLSRNEQDFQKKPSQPPRLKLCKNSSSFSFGLKCSGAGRRLPMVRYPPRVASLASPGNLGSRRGRCDG